MLFRRTSGPWRSFVLLTGAILVGVALSACTLGSGVIDTKSGSGSGGARAGTSGSGGVHVANGTGGLGGGATGGAGLPATGGATAVATARLCNWPTSTGSDQPVAKTIAVSDTFDGGMQRYVGSGSLGTSGQGENQGPLFRLAEGATLQNVILGNPAADGVHCSGTCTLKNVWWEDVGEDAATLEGTSDTQVMTVDGGGANHAADKVFQHNGPGTFVIRHFCVQDFGKLYRSCGNCGTQHPRHADISDVAAIPGDATAALAGLNTNYGDTITFHNIAVSARLDAIPICLRYTGNDTGAEPTPTGSGPDGVACLYAPTDITWQ